MKNRVSNKMLAGIAVMMIIVFALIVNYRYKINSMMEAEEISCEYEISWEGNSYSGKYQGEYSKLKPSGYGLFVSNDGSFEYDGNWKSGLFDGSGEIHYADGSWEIGNYKKGKRNGICRTYSDKSTFQELCFNKGIPYGYTVFYKDDKEVSSDLYVNGDLATNITKDTVKLTADNINDSIYNEEYYWIEGKVEFVGQVDKKCYLRIESDTVGMVICNYRNYIGSKDKQVYMPKVNTGDRVRVYGYCEGIKKDVFAEDYIGYKYDYLSIKPIYGENLSKPVEKIKKNSYNLLKQYPYLEYGKSVNGTFVINNVARSGNDFYIQAFQEGKSLNESFILLYKGKVNDVFCVDDKIQIKGYLDGQYKRLKSSEWESYNQKHSTNERIYTFQYDLYPLIYVSEIDR